MTQQRKITESISLATLCRASAWLLDYPDKTLLCTLPLLKESIESANLPREVQTNITTLIASLQKEDPLTLESHYTHIFDMNAASSLYLFEHIHGDSRKRGQAMADLLQEYHEAGFDIPKNEMPDFIPLFLEYVSTRETETILNLLTETVDIFALLQQRLFQQKSLYGKIFKALCSFSKREPRLEQIDARLKKENTSSKMPEGMETPIDFSSPGMPACSACPQRTYRHGEQNKERAF